LDPGWTLRWTPEASGAGRPARASPEDSQKPSLIRRLCPFEKCPADTFLAAAQRCAAPASSITLRFE
jgi:hypothetical protein